jgi:4-amino-4-deoxy-L-arabinose transferase-like glycosyltransferase
LDLTKHRDVIVVGATALIARLGVVAWAASRIPPAADGVYYDKVATRIAHGDGYTWLWPDGAVTYAAHYPVGYPAIVAAGYAVFGAHPVVAMLINALLGAAAAVATWVLVNNLSIRSVPAPAALFAGLAVALHPALVPYTPAIMTEGPTAALLAIAGACAVKRWRIATGIVIGIAVLVRPQSLLFAAVLGVLCAGTSL